MEAWYMASYMLCSTLQYMPPNQQSIRPRQSNPQANRMNIPPQAPNVPVFIANTQQYPHIIMQQNPEMVSNNKFLSLSSVNYVCYMV